MSKYIKLEDAEDKMYQLWEEDTDNKINSVYCFDDDRAIEALRSLPTIEVSEDCISRAWVQNKLTEYVKDVKDYGLNDFDCWQNTIVEWIATDIEDAPSVVPEKRTDKPDFADCEKCLKTYGTLGCCSTVNNKWVYSCLEGMIDYAYTRGYKDGAKMKEADDE